MLLLIVLLRSMLVKRLESYYIDLSSPTWYEDVVGDVLVAFVYHECISTLELAPKVFEDACWLLQGDKYKRLTLPEQVVSSVVGDYNATVGEGKEDNGRSKRRKTSPTEITALAKVVPNAPDVDDEVVALDLQAEEYEQEPQEVIAETGLVG
jgi:hypothetical protein